MREPNRIRFVASSPEFGRESACINTLPSPTACVCIVGHGRGSVSSVSERKGKHDRTCSGCARGPTKLYKGTADGPTGLKSLSRFQQCGSCRVTRVTHTLTYTPFFLCLSCRFLHTHIHTLCVSNPFRSVVVCKTYIHTLSSHTRSLK